MLEILIMLFCFLVSLYFINFFIHGKNETPHQDKESYDKIKEKCCVSISSPGGYDKLKIIPISTPSKGPNVPNPFDEEGNLLPGFAIIKTHAVGVNYADVCIR
jgi:hypothetical protein